MHHIPQFTLLVRVEERPIQPEAQDARIGFSRSIFASWVDVRENIAAGRNEFLRNTERAMGTSFAANVALLFVLVLKKRIQEFAVLPSGSLFLTAEMTALFVIYRWGSAHSYSAFYGSCVLVDFLLQLGVVMEMARIVLRLGHGYLTPRGDFCSLRFWALSLQQVRRSRCIQTTPCSTYGKSAEICSPASSLSHFRP